MPLAAGRRLGPYEILNADRRGGNGRGLSRTRHAARPRGRPQGPPPAVRERRRSPTTLRPGGPRGRLPRPSEHPRPARRRHGGRGLLRDLRAAEGRDPARETGPGSPPCPQGRRVRSADLPRPRRRPRRRDRPSRPEAREPRLRGRRLDQDPRLRPRPTHGRGLGTGPRIGGDADGHRRRGGPRDCRLHVPRAGAHSSRRRPLRSLQPGRDPLRDGDGAARLPGDLERRHALRDPPSRSPGDDRRPGAGAGRVQAHRTTMPREGAGRAVPVGPRPRLRPGEPVRPSPRSRRRFRLRPGEADG